MHWRNTLEGATALSILLGFLYGIYYLVDIRYPEQTGSSVNDIISHGDSELAIALQDSSAESSWTFMNNSPLIFNHDQVSKYPITEGVVVGNIISDGIEWKKPLDSVFHAMAALSNSRHAQALSVIHHHSAKTIWLIDTYRSLIETADDDVITAFAEQSGYVEEHFGGLYFTFEPEVFKGLDSLVYIAMIDRLSSGIITPLESELIDDLMEYRLKEENVLGLNHYQNEIQKDPLNGSNYFERANVLIRDYQDYESALHDYDMALQRENENAVFLLHRARCKTHLEDGKGAVQDYLQLLKFEPNNTIALLELGQLQHNQGHYDLSISTFTELLKVNNEYPQAYILRASSKSYSGDTIGALRDLGRAIELDHINREAKVERARILVSTGNAITALDDYLDLLELDENDSEALSGVAFCYFLVNDIEGALEYYEKLTHLSPADKDAFYALGVIHDEKSAYKKAYSYYTKVIFMDSAYTKAYVRRGFLSLAAGDTINACLDRISALNLGENQSRTI